MAVRTGVPWRDLPSEYGPWQTVYGLFRRWQRDRTWAELLTRLQARAVATRFDKLAVRSEATVLIAAIIDDPSEDVLFMMISDLYDSDNTFVVVQPDEDDPVWFASVAVLDEGGYEIVRRDTTRNEHTVTTATSVNDIARDLTSG